MRQADDARAQRGSMKIWIAVGLLLALLAAGAAVYFFMPEKIQYLRHGGESASPPPKAQPAMTSEREGKAPAADENTLAASSSRPEPSASDDGGSIESGSVSSPSGVSEREGEASMAASGDTFVATGVARGRAERGLALIMDDVGYGLRAVDAALALGIPLTFSILPDAPDARAAADRAHAAGQIVMLHMPMEPKDPDIADRMMKGIGLAAGMSESQLHRMVERALQRVPHAQGMSNHMGSMLTEQADSMRWLMQDLKRRGMFFLDSLTTPDSVARVQASRLGLAWASRRFFLDEDPSEAGMSAAWRQILERARRAGGCIVIFHASPSSIAFLQRHLAEADGLLVPLTALLHPAR